AAVADVTANDLVNGAAVDLTAGTGNATIAQSGTWPAGITLDPATGAVATEASLQPGLYTVAYDLCDTNTPANCETAQIEVTVAADIAPGDDTGTATSGA
ncbi:hypothetical protein, partial [Thalassorhabdomicrobium marinisediminis]|uniref:hypothetical protein n=1 Tax=Thalassorhabdomicrobium marinisediminis TaxID=2170577 RepID=UPI003CD0DE48